MTVKWDKITDLSVKSFHNIVNKPSDERILKEYEKEKIKHPNSIFTLKEYEKDIIKYMNYEKEYIYHGREGKKVKKINNDAKIKIKYTKDFFIVNGKKSYNPNWIKETTISLSKYIQRKIFPSDNELKNEYKNLNASLKEKYSFIQFKKDIDEFFKYKKEKLKENIKMPETKEFDYFDFEKKLINKNIELYNAIHKIGQFITEYEYEPTKENKKKKGIYLMYIDIPRDNYLENTYMPFYIGKTNTSKGMGSRWSRHRTEINKILELCNEMGIQRIIDFGIWRGNNLYIKIAKILTQYNLTIDSIKFRCLDSYDEINDDDLLFIEKKYIKKYDCVKYGLNQFSFVQDYIILAKYNQYGSKNENNKYNIDKLKNEIRYDFKSMIHFLKYEINDWINKGFFFINISFLLDYMNFYLISLKNIISEKEYNKIEYLLNNKRRDVYNSLKNLN